MKILGRAMLTACIAAAVAAPAVPRAQVGKVGIYTDANGSSCSLTDQSAGLLRAYVVVGSGLGHSGVRFAAPKPACFDATYLADEAPPTMLVLGNSQTGVSVAYGTCTVADAHVLTMVFFANGTTAPCCAYPVVADPIAGVIQVTDCYFNEHPAAGRTSYINANETCDCDFANSLPPSVPDTPNPGDGATVAYEPRSLSWISVDADGDAITYDVDFGFAPDPPSFAQDLELNTVEVITALPDTVYYWRVHARDATGQTTVGPVWSFRTGPSLGPPSVPATPTPADQATNQIRAHTLRWSASDPNRFPLSYDLHFGTDPSPPLAAAGIANNAHAVSGLALATTYYWQIVARSVAGVTTAGPVWSFATALTDPPPSVPSSPSPANNAIGQSRAPVLRWSSTDPEGQALAFDVYFGTAADPPLFQAGVAEKQLAVSNLLHQTAYFWRIVARDTGGGETSGPVWKFTTRSNAVPSVALVSPPNGLIVTEANVTLRWSGFDPEGEPLTYDVYYGTVDPPPLLAAGVTASEQFIPALAPNTTFWWRVVAHEAQGLTTSSAIRNFQTRSGPLPPLVPSNPSPPDSAIDVTRSPVLTWESDDPDGDALTYDVYFGTSPAPPLLDTGVSQAEFAIGTRLQPGLLYYWRIVAKDDAFHQTSGPVWRFTTISSVTPPSVPANPSPPDDAGGQPLNVMLRWDSSDLEGKVRFDVRYGNTYPPTTAFVNRSADSLLVSAPGSLTRYYWQVVAKDEDGAVVEGPVWSFVTAGVVIGPPYVGLYADAAGTTCTLDDAGPGVRSLYVVVEGGAGFISAQFTLPKPSCWNATYLGESSSGLVLGNSQTGVAVAFGSCLAPPILAMTIQYLSAGTTAGCCEFPVLASPGGGYVEVTDCNFVPIQAGGSPVLKISSDGSCEPCGKDAYLYFAAAEDTCRAGSPGQLVVDLRVIPGVGGVQSGTVGVEFDPATLVFVGCERGELAQNWDALTCVESGGTITITGTADAGHDPSASGTIARLVFESLCCAWNAPANLHIAGGTGDFAGLAYGDGHITCRFSSDGDLNNDGAVTTADAQCALETYLYAPLAPSGGCAGPFYLTRGDVDCQGGITPGDAACIFRDWLDGSCTFCDGTSVVLAAAAGAAPRVSLRAIDEGDGVVVPLRVDGVADAGAFGFELEYPREWQFVRVEPAGGASFAGLQARVKEPGLVRVGAYAGARRVAAGEVIAVRFRAAAEAGGTATARAFVDDLAGAAEAAATRGGAAVAPALSRVTLHQNTPNPFNPATAIRFELPQPAAVRLAVYAVDGSLVKVLADGRHPAGETRIDWNGTDASGRTVATGIYFCVLETGRERLQRKMVLLK